MERQSYIRRPEHYGKDISACGVMGFINHDKTLTDGSVIRRAMANIHDRGNGLGGGFAAYGIYPQYADLYAMHIMYDDKSDASEVEEYLKAKLEVHQVQEIPIFEVPAIPSYPYFKRYFVSPPAHRFPPVTDNDYMVSVVMHINVNIPHAFVISSGKNMGVFKGVGFPEDIADFFKLQEYRVISRNGAQSLSDQYPGWGWGASVFAVGLVDCAITAKFSYGTNRRYLEMFGYTCTLQTDTEVVTYLIDLLVRRHDLSFEQAATIFAPPFWKDIDLMTPEEQNRYTQLRMIYGSAALNGPFAFLVGYADGLIGLNDRVKLRPLIVATKGQTTYMASEEASVREICPDLDRVWAPRAGRPVIARLNEKPVAMCVE